MKSNEIRSIFLKFFEGQGHKVLPSFPLVTDDPTLLFNNAGMAPLKQYFFKRDDNLPRAATSQKCLRTNDLENVGHTSRHHTFFEMLGNFSFGDYFKKEACAYAWEFLVKMIGIPKESIWITVYTGDSEAVDAWKALGIAPDRIVQLKENFWTMGDTGPCGPCSELIVDRGSEKGCGKADCGITCGCDRYTEVWNLVFTQFERRKDGTLVQLEQKNIDTGMGLERLTALAQGVDSAFDTDLFKPVISSLCERYNLSYDENKVPLRVISDHVRGALFLITEGIYPSNEGRGYVLRRILRRAIRHGKKWDANPFLYRLVPLAAETMKEAYPEIMDKREYASGVILEEEKNFDATLNHGIKMMQEIIDSARSRGTQVIQGPDIFRLYDTYGLPVDFIREIASENGLSVDEEAYVKEMDRQRSRSRDSREKKEYTIKDAESGRLSCEFDGYDTLTVETRVKAVFAGGDEVGSLAQGTEGIVILERTPFYGESGGQAGDTGAIFNKDCRLEVSDTQKPGMHAVKVVRGEIRKGDAVTASVDRLKRDYTARHHTATHLLQSALRSVLGSHVEQRGSLVTPGYLRFDFTHAPVLAKEELLKIEELVNGNIAGNAEVSTEITTLEEAKKSGAMAIFQEKYEESGVRMVSIGDPFFSRELCGGTHVRKTGEIGLFRITAHEGVAKGIRRIEAACSMPAYFSAREQLLELEDISGLLSLPADKAAKGVRDLIEKKEKNESLIKKLRGEIINKKIPELLERAEMAGAAAVVAGYLEFADHDSLAGAYESIEKAFKPAVAILGTVIDDRAVLVGRASKELKGRIDLGRVMKEVSSAIGGGGGGDAVKAQAQGTEKNGIYTAIENAKKLVIEQLSKGG